VTELPLGGWSDQEFREMAVSVFFGHHMLQHTGSRPLLL
jgi:hypothetical protein